MSNGGITFLLIGVVAAAIVVPVLYITYIRTTNVLNETPPVQNLPQPQQSTLYTLEANGGSAISMDYGTLLDAVEAVLIAMGGLIAYLFLKDR